MSNVTAETNDAGCACGQVRLRVNGKPIRVGLCHCLDCRKAHAAAFGVFVVFPADNVEIRPGEAASVGRFDRGSYSRYFCRNCGAHVYAKSEASSEIELFLGSFDVRNRFIPTYEAWSKRRENWLGPLPTIEHRYVEDAQIKTGRPVADGQSG